MLSIDRSANASVHDQLVEQLRYQIASGQYSTGETLPSTRELADRLDISFHTVRKAYQTLKDEGLLTSRVGRGYTVEERTPLSKSERMERGASTIRDTLQRLIGLGLTGDEIEHLVQEQLGLLERAGRARKLLFVAPYRELAEECAGHLSSRLQRSVGATTLDQLGRHRDTDFAFTPYPHLQEVMQTLPRADVLGAVTYLQPEALERVARLLPRETLGLVTRYADAIQPLTQALRTHTGFSGQILAASIDEGTDHLASFIEELDEVVYTPASQQRLLSLIDDELPHTKLAFAISSASVEAIRSAVPSE